MEGDNWRMGDVLFFRWLDTLVKLRLGSDGDKMVAGLSGDECRMLEMCGVGDKAVSMDRCFGFLFLVVFVLLMLDMLLFEGGVLNVTVDLGEMRLLWRVDTTDDNALN